LLKLKQAYFDCWTHAWWKNRAWCFEMDIG